MKLRRTSVLAGATAAAILALTACSTSGTTTHDEKVFSLSGDRLVIEVATSDFRLIPWNGPGVQVQRSLSGTAAKPGNSSWTLSGDTLQLSINCSGLVLSCGSNFQVAVPPGVSVDVHSGPHNDTVSGISGAVVIEGGSGQVQISGTSGSLRISTGSGSITASSIHSPTVYASSNQGSVDIGFSTAPQLVDINTGTGNATVRVPTSGHQYQVSATSGTGTVESKVPSNHQSSSVVRVSSGNGNASVLSAS